MPAGVGIITHIAALCGDGVVPELLGMKENCHRGRGAARLRGD